MLHSNRSTVLVTAVLALLATTPSAQGRADAQGPSLLENGSVNQPCKLAISSNGFINYRGPYSRGYDSRSKTLHAERASIDILSDNSGCRYVLVVEPDGGKGQLISGNQALDFDVRALGSQTDGSAERVELSGRTQGGRQGARQQVELIIPPGQDVAAGLYRGFLKIALYDDSDGMLEFVDEQRLEVSAEVQPRISASFGSDPGASSNRRDLDFGSLRKGRRENVDFSVSANVGYEVRLRSLNGGNLIHEHADMSIAYDVELDGKAVVMDEIASNAPDLTGNTVSQHRLEFIIAGNPGNSVAGRYSDEVTVIITAE
ncbi:hypothetical protein [Henriciella sp.]|uniref:hypothetical protein n=1 Tax=Henriciella sp. TaxID=1968823 RepID=UPI00262327F6|nr:hypothetical protein [Henriciella sp.]